MGILTFVKGNFPPPLDSPWFLLGAGLSKRAFNYVSFNWRRSPHPQQMRSAGSGITVVEFVWAALLRHRLRAGLGWAWESGGWLCWCCLRVSPEQLTSPSWAQQGPEAVVTSSKQSELALYPSARAPRQQLYPVKFEETSILAGAFNCKIFMFTRPTCYPC